MISALLAFDGGYLQQPGETIPLIFVIALATLVGSLLAAQARPVTATLADPCAATVLAGLQTVRVLGVAFLLILAGGGLPPVFALRAGLGDLTVGLAAPCVAYRLATGRGGRAARWLNVVGIGDLVIALATGFAVAPGPYQLLEATPPTGALAQFPLALIPTIAVPLAATLHITLARSLRLSEGGARHRWPAAACPTADLG